MFRIAFVGLLLIFPVADLLQAWLFEITGSTYVVIIRYIRDGLTALLFIAAIKGAQTISPGLRLSAFIFIAFLGLLSFVSVLRGLPHGE